MSTGGSLVRTYERLLAVHYAAPGHTLTTRQLADAMGWESHSSVNVHYGTLGKELARRLDWRRPVEAPDAASIATFVGGSAEAPGTQWVMHQELAEGIRTAGVRELLRGGT